MIEFNSFDLLNYFLFKKYQFFEDKVIIKVKSLLTELDDEIIYENIKIISLIKYRNIRWFNAGIFILAILALVHTFAGFIYRALPYAEMVEKVIIVLGYMLIIPSFFQREIMFFLDENRDVLFSFVINKNNRPSVSKIIDLIKQKTKNIESLNYDGSAPTETPAYEIVQRDFPDIFKVSITKFYDDKIVFSIKNLLQEFTGEIKYSELSKKIENIRSVDQTWGVLWSNGMFIILALEISKRLFFPNFLGGYWLYFFIGFGSLLILMFLLGYVKYDHLLFLNKNNHILLTIKQDASNWEKLDEIIEFVEGKIPS